MQLHTWRLLVLDSCRAMLPACPPPGSWAGCGAAAGGAGPPSATWWLCCCCCLRNALSRLANSCSGAPAAGRGWPSGGAEACRAASSESSELSMELRPAKPTLSELPWWASQLHVTMGYGLCRSCEAKEQRTLAVPLMVMDAHPRQHVTLMFQCYKLLMLTHCLVPNTSTGEEHLAFMQDTCSCLQVNKTSLSYWWHRLKRHLQAHGPDRFQEGGRAVTAEHMLQRILTGCSLRRRCEGWCEQRGAGKRRRKARRGYPWDIPNSVPHSVTR